MLSTISTLTIGFSVVMAALFFTLYLCFFNNVNKSWFAICSCAGLLTALCALQLEHLAFLQHHTDSLDTLFYRILTFLTPAMFYYFSRAILFPDAKVNPLLVAHLIAPGWRHRSMPKHNGSSQKKADEKKDV